jgi:hypothetical protein
MRRESYSTGQKTTTNYLSGATLILTINSDTVFFDLRTPEEKVIMALKMLLVKVALSDMGFVLGVTEAAIPGEVCNPVFIEIASLSFRKHLCHNALSSQPSAHFTSESGECNGPECSQSA